MTVPKIIWDFSSQGWEVAQGKSLISGAKKIRVVFNNRKQFCVVAQFRSKMEKQSHLRVSVKLGCI